MSYRPIFADPETTKIPSTRYRDELIGLAGAGFRKRRWPVGEPGVVDRENLWREAQSHGKQIKSTVVTGTPPLVIASTTNIPNLNASTLGGTEKGSSGTKIPVLDVINTWSSNQLFDTTTKILLDNANQFLHASTSSSVTLNAVSSLNLSIGGAAEATLSENDLSFPQGVGDSVGFSWTNLLELDVLIDSITKATFSATGLDVVDQVGAANFVSDVATGTAPLIVASTTVVPNLNVDLLDGKEAAELNPTTTKGDLIGFSTVEARIPIGQNGKILVADSTKPLGLKWENPDTGAAISVATTEVFSGTSPTSYTNLDLSATIGSNTAILALSFKSASDMNALSVRKGQDTNNYYDATVESNAYGCQLGHHDGDADMVLIVAANSLGIIQWITETAQTCTVDVLWFIA